MRILIFSSQRKSRKEISRSSRRRMGMRENEMPAMEKSEMGISVQLKQYKYQLHFECFTGEHWTDTTFTLSAFFSLLLLWIEIFILFFLSFSSLMLLCIEAKFLHPSIRSLKFAFRKARWTKKKIIQSCEWNIFPWKLLSVSSEEEFRVLVAAELFRTNCRDNYAGEWHRWKYRNSKPAFHIQSHSIWFCQSFIYPLPLLTRWNQFPRNAKWKGVWKKASFRGIFFYYSVFFDVVVMYSKGCFICHLYAMRHKARQTANSRMWMEYSVSHLKFVMNVVTLKRHRRWMQLSTCPPAIIIVCAHHFQNYPI